MAGDSVRVVLKLGGALITDKRRGAFDVAKMDVINRIAREVAESKNGNELFLVHGAGSFGHPYVEKHGLLEKPTPMGVAETHLACERLCEIVCRSLVKNGIPAVPLHPLSAFRVEGGKLVFNEKFLETILKSFVPVTHGDVALLDGKWGVLSGDDITVELAERLGAQRVGFASNTEVLMDGRPLKEISLSDVKGRIDTFRLKGDVSDVTGGMAAKLLKIEKIAGKAEVFIFSGLKEGNVSAFLKGEEVGTRILP